MSNIDIKHLPVVEQLPADGTAVTLLVATVEANLCGSLEVQKGPLLEVLQSVAKSLIGSELEEEDGMYGDYDLNTSSGLVEAIDCHNQNADDQPMVMILNLDTFERYI